MIRWPLPSLFYDEIEKWLGSTTALFYVRISMVQYGGTKR